jgi:Raf kinase inhibitor-like YbhB/YbcL family protein
MKLHRSLALVAALAAFAAPLAAGAAGMTLTSSTLGGDGGRIPAANMMTGCGGQNVSLALAWSGAPAATKSYAFTIWDQDGRKGQGVMHWIAYGIPAATTSFAAGATSQAGPGFVGGKNTRDMLTYMGPCPPPGDTPHHYLITVYALDLAPDALAPGLTRDTFFPAIADHTLASTSIIGLSGR